MEISVRRNGIVQLWLSSHRQHGGEQNALGNTQSLALIRHCEIVEFALSPKLNNTRRLLKTLPPFFLSTEISLTEPSLRFPLHAYFQWSEQMALLLRIKRVSWGTLERFGELWHILQS